MMLPWVPQKLPLENLDWAKYIRLIGRANAELARYDGILQGIVNPDVLLSPLSLQEAVLSSRIEGTQASLEEVLEYEAAEEAEPERAGDIREVLNYRRAMFAAISYLQDRPVCLDLLKNLHASLMDGVRGQERGRGRFRSVQNWIGRAGSTIESARFVPPEPVAMLESLSNWEKYIHGDEQDRLVQLALIHGQFEIIHPFTDGNGRVGRMLIPLVLYQYKLISRPAFYLSAYLERHRETYYERLLGITARGEWDEWVLFFLTAVAEQAKEDTTKAKTILELYDRMKVKLPEIVPTQFTVQALDAIFDRPVFKTTEFIERSGIPKQSAMRILGALLDHGVLTTVRSGSGRRAAILMFRQLIDLAEGKAGGAAVPNGS